MKISKTKKSIIFVIAVAIFITSVIITSSENQRIEKETTEAREIGNDAFERTLANCITSLPDGSRFCDENLESNFFTVCKGGFDLEICKKGNVIAEYYLAREHYKTNKETYSTPQKYEGMNLTANNYLDICFKALEEGYALCGSELRTSIESVCKTANDLLDICDYKRLNDYFQIKESHENITNKKIIINSTNLQKIED